MLDTYSVTPQTLSEGEIIQFTQNRHQTHCNISHSLGTGSIALLKPGYYLVDFTGVASATAAATAAATDPITVQLNVNGAPLNGAYASALSAAADTPVNLSFSTIVKVFPSCRACNNDTALTLVNGEVEALYSKVELVITHLS